MGETGWDETLLPYSNMGLLRSQASDDYDS